MSAKVPTMNKKLIKIGEAAMMSSLSRDTIRRYEERGWVAPVRDWAGRRLFTIDQVERLMSISNGSIDPRNEAAV